MIKSKHNFKYNALYLSLCCANALVFSPFSWAEDEFSGNFLRGDQNQLAIDVSRFNRQNAVLAGHYQAEVWVNDKRKGSVDLHFVDKTQQKDTALCLTPALKAVLDLKAAAYAFVTRNEDCLDVEKAVPEGKFLFDVGNLRLNLSIPQALTETRPYDWVPPQLWQDGVPAFYTNYYFNAYNTQSADFHSTQMNLNLRSGVNLWGWSLVHSGSKSWQKTNRFNDFQSKYQANETFVRRAIPQWQSEIYFGDMNTSGELLESLSLRGVRLMTDTRSLPSSQRGYSPIVQGIANSNANITIRQNGFVVYQTAVPAGHFLIDDLNLGGSSGDLMVEILESNGERREFKVPFATLIQLVRPKQLKYQLAYGHYRAGTTLFDDRVFQGTLQYGVSNNLSLNYGLSGAPNYRSYLLGFGLNTPIGAFAFDSTWSDARFVKRNQRREGYSIRAHYSTKLASDTYITLATYRYSSRDFYTLGDVIQANRANVIHDRELQSRLYLRPKNQYQLTMSQNFGEKKGSLYLSGSTQNYWNKKGHHHQYQISYANSIGNLSYNLSYSQSRDMQGAKNQSFYLGFSMPFGGAHQISNSYGQGSQYRYAKMGLNGALAENLYYGVGISQSKGKYRSMDANLDYNSPYMNINLSGSRDNLHNKQYAANVSGAIVAHPKGVTLAPTVGDTFAIVHAKGATGAKINGVDTQKIDIFGNGIMPNLIPYSRNTLNLDPDNLPLNMEFNATATELIPKAYSTMLVEFDMRENPMVLFEIQLDNGKIIPMGAEGVDEQGQSVGDVVQGGQLFAQRLTQPQGSIFVHWGNDADQQCRFDYHLAKAQHHGELKILPVRCARLQPTK